MARVLAGDLEGTVQFSNDEEGDQGVPNGYVGWLEIDDVKLFVTEEQANAIARHCEAMVLDTIAAHYHPDDGDYLVSE